MESEDDSKTHLWLLERRHVIVSDFSDVPKVTTKVPPGNGTQDDKCEEQEKQEHWTVWASVTLRQKPEKMNSNLRYVLVSLYSTKYHKLFSTENWFLVFFQCSLAVESTSMYETCFINKTSFPIFPLIESTNTVIASRAPILITRSLIQQFLI